MIPLYILGILRRFGPQHGYNIKKMISEQCSDFTQIKLPVIYYHLEKMEAAGLLSASQTQEGSRPEKTVYTITAKGHKAFTEKLEKLLSFEYRPAFPSDSVFFFSDSLDNESIRGKLAGYIKTLDIIISSIEGHQAQAYEHVPEGETKASADIIFSHHLLHYRAEREWASQAIKTLENLEEGK